MFGLQVNSFMDICNYDDAMAHMIIASKMDIMNVFSSEPLVSLASWNEVIHEMETNTDGNQDPNSPTEWPTIHDDLHSLVCDPTIGLFILGADHMNSHETHVTVTPLKVPHAPILSLFGTPTCRVGFFSTAGPSCIAGLWQRRMWSLRQKLGAQLLLGGGLNK